MPKSAANEIHGQESVRVASRTDSGRHLSLPHGMFVLAHVIEFSTMNLRDGPNQGRRGMSLGDMRGDSVIHFSESNL